ncbi:MAG: helix-turn-helix domain-containing protein [Burkholderiales bacterium]|jgi:putative transposase|nr:helix-turn-helix domain-containing protein [Burkholderiales bacterium]
MTHAQAERLAKRFGVHRATVYRYRARLQEIDAASAVAGRKRGWKPFASRLSAQQEEAVEDAIRVMRKKAGPLRVIDLVEEVGALCRLKQIPCPSRPTIDRRLRRAKVRVHRRGVATPGTADPKIAPGTFVVQRPLDVVAIDHTPMDIVVVDDLYRQPLGKPYLTLATDVATRCILGFVITFVPPGAGTVSLCA